MRSYGAAKILFGIFGLISWALIAGGAIAVLAGVLDPDGPVAAAGAAAVFSGFLMLAMVQIGRSTVDTADCAQQILMVSRQQLDVSERILEQVSMNMDGRAALNSASEEHDDAAPRVF